MDLPAAFAAIPGVIPVDGIRDAWFWSFAPKFGFSAVLSQDGKNAFQCFALNS